MIAVSREQPGARPACARSVPAVRRLQSTESALSVSYVLRVLVLRHRFRRSRRPMTSAIKADDPEDRWAARTLHRPPPMMTPADEPDDCA